MTLTDCFAPFLAYLLHFQRTASENVKPVDEIRSELLALLTQGEEGAQRGEIPPTSVDRARFALCAFADEVILNSSYGARDAWLKEELQRHFYGTSEAGEEFFRRLGDLMPYEQEVREVYYLCLALGFTGRYCRAGGGEALKQVREEQLAILSCSASDAPFEGRNLFPGGYPQDLPATGKDTGALFLSRAPLLALAAPVILFAILFCVFRFALGGMAEDLLKKVPF